MTDNPTRIQKIIDRHVHDVRNSINCLDLSAALIGELCTDPAFAKPVTILRTEVTKLVETLNALQLKFTEPRKVTISSHDFFQLWKDKIVPMENSTNRTTWQSSTASGTLTVDVNAILSVLRELVVTGWQLASDGSVKATVSATEAGIIAEVRENKPRAPRDAHDMEEARLLVAMSGGTLDVTKDPESGERVVTLRFAKVD